MKTGFIGSVFRFRLSCFALPGGENGKVSDPPRTSPDLTDLCDVCALLVERTAEQDRHRRLISHLMVTASHQEEAKS